MRFLSLIETLITEILLCLTFIFTYKTWEALAECTELLTLLGCSVWKRFEVHYWDMIMHSNFSSFSWHLKYQEWYITISDSFPLGSWHISKVGRVHRVQNWNQNHPMPIHSRWVKDGCSLNPSLLQCHILSCSELFWFSSKTKELRIHFVWVIKK